MAYLDNNQTPDLAGRRTLKAEYAFSLSAADPHDFREKRVLGSPDVRFPE
jgi:hypothetical protein